MEQPQGPVASFYADWGNWLPIMQAYEARKPSYFATPAVNLVCALNISLGQILEEGMAGAGRSPSTHWRRVPGGYHAMGLGTVPTEAGHSANTLSAPRYPDGIGAPISCRRSAPPGSFSPAVCTRRSSPSTFASATWALFGRVICWLLLGRSKQGFISVGMALSLGVALLLRSGFWWGVRCGRGDHRARDRGRIRNGLRLELGHGRTRSTR